MRFNEGFAKMFSHKLYKKPTDSLSNFIPDLASPDRSSQTGRAQLMLSV
jgi:hypothetical protein